MDSITCLPNQHEWLVRAARWTRQQHLRYPVALWFFLRIWSFVWAAVAAGLIPPLAVSYAKEYHGMTPLTGGLDQVLWAPWQRWDTIWYTKIAEQGYSSSDLTTAFFPLYPLLIKVTAPLCNGNTVAAGVLVASIAALACFVLLYQTTRAQYGASVAQRTLLYFAVFPTAFFLFAAYTESLFLALVLGAFMCALAKRWGWSGILGALAALTRPQGMLVILPLMLEFLLQYRRGRVNWRVAANLVLVVLGGLAFWLYLALKFQNPTAGWQVQSLIRSSALPWQTLSAALVQVLSNSDRAQMVLGGIELLIAGLFLALTVWSFFRLRLSLFAYMLITIMPSFFSLASYNPVSPLPISRYALVAFPGFMLLGLHNRWAHSKLLVIVLSFLLQTLNILLFSSWVFVG